MSVEEALFWLHFSLQQNRLEHKLLDVHELVFKHSWDGKSYGEMAEISGYDNEYIKHVGSKLWQIISESAGRKVTKSNVRSVLEQCLRQSNQEYLLEAPNRKTSSLAYS